MSAFESSTKINFLSLALRAGGGTLLIMQVVSGDAYLSSYLYFSVSDFVLRNHLLIPQN